MHASDARKKMILCRFSFLRAPNTISRQKEEERTEQNLPWSYLCAEGRKAPSLAHSSQPSCRPSTQGQVPKRSGAGEGASAF